MQKPLCRLCGARHWNNEPHVFEDSNSREVGKAEDRKVNLPTAPKPSAVRKDSGSDKRNTLEKNPGAPESGVESTGSDKGRTPNRRDRAAYNAYMKEYMRRRREGNN